MMRASAGSASTCLAIASRSRVSACSLCGLEMLTSGSMIGTRPAARIRSAYSNCWSTIAAMPASLASLITDRIFVPKIPCLFALASWSSRVVIGFMSWTSSCSAASPRSTLRNGTTFLVSHRYWAVGTPSIVRSMVCRNRIAARIRVPSNSALVMTRVRMAWTRSNIWSSVEYRSRLTPYSSSAFGVLPPLWSRAAKNPWPDLTFSNCCVFTPPDSVTRHAGGASQAGRQPRAVQRRARE